MHLEPTRTPSHKDAIRRNMAAPPGAAGLGAEEGDRPMKKPHDPDLEEKVARLRDLIRREKDAILAKDHRDLGADLRRCVDADDVFQEASMVVVEKLPELDVRDERAFRNYFFLEVWRAAKNL